MGHPRGCQATGTDRAVSCAVPPDSPAVGGLLTWASARTVGGNIPALLTGQTARVTAASSGAEGLTSEVGRTHRTGTREGRGGARVHLDTAVRRWA
ncbi:rieske domain protein [Deinococcus grandis]|uniref:Rieske domain protein n=1 Tax=Deinococcus grandis TaxID=57498 RepID=A0A117DNN6_9DEIO|nr:hypothetical protein DEGR_12420 [Deinococcus grandis]GAQ21992.1 rieske domain protein [Deinococcus grandis]